MFKIHPAIGVARVGDSENSFYYGPESDGGLPTEADGTNVKSFRDAQGRLRRQAARFRVYSYKTPDSEGQELQIGDLVNVNGRTERLASIRWTVYLANKKASWYAFEQLSGEQGYAPDHPLRNDGIKGEARKRLIVDPGPLTLDGINQRAEFTLGKAQGHYPQNFPPPLKPFSITTLGEIQTDGANRLVVLGGFGRSGSTTTPGIKHYANNDNWFDDISDGPVSAILILNDGTEVPVDAPAWVLATPPGYVPQILNMVTLYDTLYDLAVRSFSYRPVLFQDGEFQVAYRPSFSEEIAPILKRPAVYQWVANLPENARSAHAPLAQGNFNEFPFGIVRGPGGENQPGLMPQLAGDDPINAPPQAQFLSLTATQYFLLQQWSKGIFQQPDTGAQRLTPGEDLDRAILVNCVGGAFCPGIELTWISRNPEIYSEPFRIKHKKLTASGLSLGQDFKQGLEPGDLSKYMAIPWQADFNECSTQGESGGNPLWWWPAARPYYVYPEGGTLVALPWTDGIPTDLDMVTSWNKLGFVINRGTDENPNYVEIERTLPRTGFSPEDLAKGVFKIATQKV